METACKKNNHTAQAKLKLNHYLHQVFIKNMSLKNLQKMLRKSPALKSPPELLFLKMLIFAWAL